MLWITTEGGLLISPHLGYLIIHYSTETFQNCGQSCSLFSITCSGSFSPHLQYLIIHTVPQRFSRSVDAHYKNFNLFYKEMFAFPPSCLLKYFDKMFSQIRFNQINNQVVLMINIFSFTEIYNILLL